MPKRRATFNLEEEILEELRNAAVYLRITLSGLVSKACKKELRSLKAKHKMSEFPGRKGLRGRPVN